MDVQQSYDQWATQYDSNINKTRDLEATALRNTLKDIPFKTCLEAGCGTGKNTVWFADRATDILSVDLSEEMLAKAKEKIHGNNVEFIQADISQPWSFSKKDLDVVSFSLVLEHIEDLDHIFKEAYAALRTGGHLYIGELHPFKQYSGSKARFETAEGTHTVKCFDHHISEFLTGAGKAGFELVNLDEYFDDNDTTQVPRLLVLLFRKR